MNKFYFATIFLSAVFYNCYSQQSQNLRLEYSGGKKEFDKLVGRAYSSSIGDEPFKYEEINKFYEIQFTVGKNGNLGDSILVSSINDTIAVPYFLKMIRSTQGKWINRSGTDLLVFLPIYVTFSESKSGFYPTFRPKHSFFLDTIKLQVLTLEPELITRSPTVSKK